MTCDHLCRSSRDVWMCTMTVGLIRAGHLISPMWLEDMFLVSTSLSLSFIPFVFFFPPASTCNDQIRLDVPSTGSSVTVRIYNAPSLPHHLFQLFSYHLKRVRKGQYNEMKGAHDVCCGTPPPEVAVNSVTAQTPIHTKGPGTLKGRSRDAVKLFTAAASTAADPSQALCLSQICPQGSSCWRVDAICDALIKQCAA